MNSRTLISVAVIGAAVFCGASVYATCDKTYSGPNGGEWGTGVYWSPPGQPDSDDNVCIPPDKHVSIGATSPAHDYAKSINIQWNPLSEERGGIHIVGGRTLHLYDDSIVHGTLSFSKQGRLELEDSLTIQGDGGNIWGSPDGTGDTCEIFVGIYGLTIEGIGTNDERENSLTVHGELHILRDCEGIPCVKTFLVNKAWVVADDDTYEVEPLEIRAENTGAVTTTAEGRWVAEKGARLEFANTVEITGSGTWLLEDHEASVIEVNRASTRLSGPVVLTKGILELNANFTTAGNLSFESVDDSTAQMVLKKGVIAQFGN